MKKHVDVDHVVLVKRFKDMNSPLINVFERQPTKKRPNVSNFEILKFFGCKRSF